MFDYILDTRCPEHPGCVAYTDAVRELQAFSLHQLQRLAMRFPNDFVVSRTPQTRLLLVLTFADYFRRSAAKDRVSQSNGSSR